MMQRQLVFPFIIVNHLIQYGILLDLVGGTMQPIYEGGGLIFSITPGMAQAPPPLISACIGQP